MLEIESIIIQNALETSETKFACIQGIDNSPSLLKRAMESEDVQCSKASTLNALRDLLDRMDEELGPLWLMEYLPMLKLNFTPTEAANLLTHMAANRLKKGNFLTECCLNGVDDNVATPTDRLRTLLETKWCRGELCRRIKGLLDSFTKEIVAEVVSEETASAMKSD